MNIGIIGGADGPTSIFIASTIISPIEQVLISVALALLLIHEMDAIRAKEWKMFVILKDMPDEVAYRIFTLVHVPLYVVVLFILLHGDTVASYALKIIIDIFIFGHAILHFAFRKHKENGFQTWFSKTIIYSMSVFGCLHLCLLLLL